MEVSQEGVPPAGLQHYVPLAPYTTIGIGGCCREYVSVKSESQLVAALQYAQAERLPVFVLGGGSNILVADEGLAGLVIHMDIRGTWYSRENPQVNADMPTEEHLLANFEYDPTTDRGEPVFVTAAAGEVWDEFVASTVALNLSGMECLSGIPGRVGASPIQNIGAYGQEVKDTIVCVRALDRINGQMVTFGNSECRFSYRSSRFKTIDYDRYVITQVTFRLTAGGTPAIRYADLVRYFEGRDIATVSLAETRKAVLEIRRHKAMVYDPKDPNSKGCGSFFTNPIVPEDQVPLIVQKGLSSGHLAPDEKMPAFDSIPGSVKLSAAWLISHSNLQRGMIHGNVGLSEKHVLAIINRGGGTAREVKELAALIQERVFEAFGVSLEPEPLFIGGIV